MLFFQTSIREFQSVVNQFNSIYTTNKFTYKQEFNKSLPFIDLLVIVIHNSMYNNICTWNLTF